LPKLNVDDKVLKFLKGKISSIVNKVVPAEALSKKLENLSSFIQNTKLTVPDASSVSESVFQEKESNKILTHLKNAYVKYYTREIRKLRSQKE